MFPIESLYWLRTIGTENFIHEKKDLPTCPACNTNHEEQPDSHLNEVMNMTEGGQP